MGPLRQICPHAANLYLQLFCSVVLIYIHVEMSKRKLQCPASTLSLSV